MLRHYLAAMRAAGDATRTRILKMLQNRELCVCQIMAVLNMSSSTVSRHLSILRMAGLVRDRKEGRWVYYSWEDAERFRAMPTSGSGPCRPRRSEATLVWPV